MKRAALFVLFAVLTANAFGQKLNKSSAPATEVGWNFTDINSVVATISYEGVFADYLRTASASVVWPKGSDKLAVFASGLWIVGKHRPTDSLRAAVMCYSNEYRPGKILSTFNTTTNSPSAADDPMKPEYRLYKITGAIQNEDYTQWPVHLGAPFNDVNGNGVWDSGIDSPVKWGDQQLWTVSNDADSMEHLTLAATKPLGVELQSTIFGYDLPGAIGNTIFIRYKIINKSDADYDSVYIGYWSDIDMGDANDDMMGSDTLRDMLYVYNYDNDDQGPHGYGAKPPATGFVLLQGPKIFTGISTDTARMQGKKIPGYKNLPMNAFVVYLAGGGGIELNWVDPPIGQSRFARAAFNNMKGLTHIAYPVVNPVTGQPTRFTFSGDPVTGSGWTQGKTTTAMDMRGVMSAGPMTLAKNDTQEVVFAYTIAQGDDRLASVTLLRNYVDEIRSIFNADFVDPRLVSDGPKMYVEYGGNAHSFDRHEIGTPADTVEFIIGNIGNATLAVHQQGISNPVFVQVSPESTSFVIQPGSLTSVRICFNPTEPGMVQDSIVFTTNDSSKLRFVFYVSGTGVHIQPVNPGFIYACDASTLYTLSSSNGGGTFIANFEIPVSDLVVRPSTKELIGMSINELVRINASTGSYIKIPHSLGNHTITGGLSFMNDTMLVFGADSVIARININTGLIDTVHRFLEKYRVRSLSYNSLTNEIYFTSFALIFNPDTLDVIYKINASTKFITRIGRTKFNIRPRALLFDKNGKLYGLNNSQSSSKLIDINTSTGEGTLIGATGVDYLVGLAMDPSSPAGIEKRNTGLPASYTLFQNYPNPFNPGTVISYQVPRSSRITLELFDIVGRKLATLVNEEQEGGRYDYRLDISSLKLSSGIYLYKLQSGTFVDVKKMCVIK